MTEVDIENQIAQEPIADIETHEQRRLQHERMGQAWNTCLDEPTDGWS